MSETNPSGPSGPSGSSGSSGSPGEPTRSIDVSVEVTGTPEQVWQAISTGQGVNAWFVPARIDGHQGGKMTLDFGEMGEETGVLTTWDPPHRLVTTWQAWGNDRESALELVVEAREGGT